MNFNHTICSASNFANNHICLNDYICIGLQTKFEVITKGYSLITSVSILLFPGLGDDILQVTALFFKISTKYTIDCKNVYLIPNATHVFAKKTRIRNKHIFQAISVWKIYIFSK